MFILIIMIRSYSQDFCWFPTIYSVSNHGCCLQPPQYNYIDHDTTKCSWFSIYRIGNPSKNTYSSRILLYYSSYSDSCNVVHTWLSKLAEFFLFFLTHEPWNFYSYHEIAVPVPVVAWPHCLKDLTILMLHSLTIWFTYACMLIDV